MDYGRYCLPAGKLAECPSRGKQSKEKTCKPFEFYTPGQYPLCMTRFIAYYRVSTDKQGKSGLGLDAQRQAVAGFVAGRGEIVAEHTEIESTRNKRPELHAALEACRKHKATLLIARLDRLARNVAFISNLMESRVDFLAVDMPEANRLTIHILAAVAEHEREMISKRTKAALQAAKARGTALGKPQSPSRVASGHHGPETADGAVSRHHETIDSKPPASGLFPGSHRHGTQ